MGTRENRLTGFSNEYQQSMLWSKNKKIMYTPENPQFYYIKVGCKCGYNSHGPVILMMLDSLEIIVACDL